MHPVGWARPVARPWPRGDLRVRRGGGGRLMGRHAGTSLHGVDHGLGRIHRNEPWHHELRPGAVDTYAAPTHDPWMRRSAAASVVGPGPFLPEDLEDAPPELVLDPLRECGEAHGD